MDFPLPSTVSEDRRIFANALREIGLASITNATAINFKGHVPYTEVAQDLDKITEKLVMLAKLVKLRMEQGHS